MSVCLPVPKDLGNNFKDMYLRYSLAIIYPPTQEISQTKISLQPPKKGRDTNNPSLLWCSERPLHIFLLESIQYLSATFIILQSFFIPNIIFLPGTHNRMSLADPGTAGVALLRYRITHLQAFHPRQVQRRQLVQDLGVRVRSIHLIKSILS